MYRHDQRTVMTLDAGGTNFVFSAIRGNQDIVETICLPAVSDNLNGCLTVLKKGFSAVKRQLENDLLLRNRRKRTIRHTERYRGE